MKPGFYWAVLYGETMVVEVMKDEIDMDTVKTFHYGYQQIDDIEFISKEPLKI